MTRPTPPASGKGERYARAIEALLDSWVLDDMPKSSSVLRHAAAFLRSSGKFSKGDEADRKLGRAVRRMKKCRALENMGGGQWTLWAREHFTWSGDIFKTPEAALASLHGKRKGKS